MEHVQRTYLPATGSDWALPLYDPLVKLLGADKVRRTLLDQAALQPNDRVLDIGCGTGTLATLIKQLYATVDVVGLDPDPKALTRARGKAQRATVSVQFDQGFSDELPYADASFNRVFSSFMLHHLQPDVKERTLCEAHRVLAPGGSLHLLDFERSESHGILARHLATHLKENSEVRIVRPYAAGWIHASDESDGRRHAFWPLALRLLPRTCSRMNGFLRMANHLGNCADRRIPNDPG